MAHCDGRRRQCQPASPLRKSVGPKGRAYGVRSRNEGAYVVPNEIPRTMNRHMRPVGRPCTSECQPHGRVSNFHDHATRSRRSIHESLLRSIRRALQSSLRVATSQVAPGASLPLCSSRMWLQAGKASNCWSMRQTLGADSSRLRTRCTLLIRGLSSCCTGKERTRLHPTSADACQPRTPHTATGTRGAGGSLTRTRMGSWRVMTVISAVCGRRRWARGVLPKRLWREARSRSRTFCAASWLGFAHIRRVGALWAFVASRLTSLWLVFAHAAWIAVALALCRLMVACVAARFEAADGACTF